MNLPINPNLARIPTYQPGRPIEEVARELGLPAANIIKLASNENPLGPSPAALASMENVLRNLHLYPDGNAFYFKRRLAEKLGVSPEHLILGNGSNEIIEFTGHALIVPGAEVLVSQYCFAVYPIVTQLFGGVLVTVPAAMTCLRWRRPSPLARGLSSPRTRTTRRARSRPRPT
jgi:histidinol-phosphate aminotransferase